MRTPTRRGRGAIAGAVALALAASLAACTGSDDERSGADAAADELAAALAAGDLSDAPLGGDPASATADLTETIEGMGGRTPEVEVAQVDTDGGGATATLAWSWPLTDDATWDYTSTVTLTESGGTWTAAYARSVVEPSLADDAVLDLTTLVARRGAITGASGAAIVKDRPVVHVGIDKTKVGGARAGASARALARLTGIDVRSFTTQVTKAGAKAFVEAITYRRDEVPDDVALAPASITGAALFPDTRPLAPSRDFAAPIIGTVGPVTADMIKKAPDTYQVGDEAGLSGLQARYDEQLRGTDGVLVESLGAGGETEELFRTDATDGSALKLTLDPGLETAAERLLADVGPASAIVAIKPSTGAILAAANGPGNNGQNLATFGQYAPGSTFKIVSSLALLRSGLTPDSALSCPATTVVDGKQFKNYSDYPSSGLGQIPLRTAVANSCNTAFIGARDGLGQKSLTQAAAALGVGVDHDLGFPAYFGSVPAPATETEKAADLIGQGKILASPMAMAAVLASLGREQVVVPRLIQTVKVTAPDVDPVSRTEAGQLKSMLRQVVTEGSGRGLLDVPGKPVIAKTGTAEYSDGGSVKTHAWMVALQGDLAVAVFVGTGESGSQTAGPILENFLRAAG